MLEGPGRDLGFNVIFQVRAQVLRSCSERVHMSLVVLLDANRKCPEVPVPFEMVIDLST
jgi:hypothetical protein